MWLVSRNTLLSDLALSTITLFSYSLQSSNSEESSEPIAAVF